MQYMSLTYSMALVLLFIIFLSMVSVVRRPAAQNPAPMPSHYVPDQPQEPCGDDCWCDGGGVLVEGVCLPNQRLAEGCWVTVQCLSPHSVCRRPSGRLLHSLHQDLWQAYMDTNQSERFVPGRCSCDVDFVLRSVPDGELVCVKRAISGPCRSNYECGKRTRFSICSDKKCACISPSYEYDRATDQCTPTDTKLACESGSCPLPWFPGTYGEMCFYGFSGSMTLVLAFWMFCSCSRPARSLTSAYEHYQEVRITGIPESTDWDEEPPSYEAVVGEGGRPLMPASLSP